MAAAAVKPKVTEVCPGVTLTTTRVDKPELKIEYHLEVSRLKVVTITMDFAGSENMALEDGSLKIEQEVQPFERKRLGALSRQNKHSGCSWKYSYSLVFADPDEATLKEYVKKDEEKIQSMISIASTLDFGADSASTRDLIQRCKDNGIHFLDIEFPPSGEALAPPEVSDVDISHVTWRRPRQFFPPTEGGPSATQLPFDIFVGSIEPNDIRQGQLADCWFLCALASLAERPENVYSIFDVENSGRSGAGAGGSAGGGEIAVHANEEGVYKMKFCKNGQWVEVRVDDYFPCAPCGGPVYSKSHGNELWVLLLEKAYAKLHGAYAKLRYGFTHEALMDLTGAPVRVFRLDGQLETELIESGEFWTMLETFDRLGHLMTCDTPGSDVWTESGGEPVGGPGLVKGHAYTLLRCATLSTEQKLVFIRNPWGSFEWNGDWSDSSPLWTEELKKEVGFVADASDGCFWMSFEDFLKFFVRVVVCRLTTKTGEKWREARIKGSFTRQRTAYGIPAVSSTPFRMYVPRDAEVIVGLHQVDTRCTGGQPYIDCGITVMQSLGDDKYELIAATGMEVDRQCQLSTNLKAGEYLVVPRTTGCKLEIADMTGDKTKVELYNRVKREFSPECLLALHEVFNRFDADLDGVLSRKEMNKFQRLTDGCDMGEEEYRFLVQYFDNRDGMLTRDGFIAAYKYIFESRGCDLDQLWRELKSLGYNEQLELVDARSFVVSVHADCDPGVTMEEVVFDPEMYEEAMELPILKEGKATEYADGMIVVYSQMSSFGGLSFALKNNTTFRGVFTMDLSSGGMNVMSHQGNLAAEVVVEPGETEILHHLMVIDPSAAYRYPGYSLAWRWEAAK